MGVIPIKKDRLKAVISDKRGEGFEDPMCMINFRVEVISFSPKAFALIRASGQCGIADARAPIPLLRLTSDVTQS
jgi:hypothetical protein